MSTFEDALENTGWGLYNYGIIIMCGFCFMAEGSLTAALSNILPISVKELSPTDKSLFPFYTAHTVGMALGGVFGGVALDAAGRRCAVPFSLMTAFTGASIWAFAGSKEFLLCAMLVLGAGLGMHTISARIYLSEAMPASGRGARIALLSIFWAIGFFFATALQMLLSPSAEQKPHNFRPASWRVVVSMSACFAVMVACTCGALVPSARWMVARRRADAAAEQLRQMYAINKSQHADTFEAPRVKGTVREFPESWRLRDDTAFCKFMWSRVGHQIGACFSRSYSVVTVVACVIRIPILNGMWTEAYWIISMIRTPCYSGKPINYMDCLVHSSNFSMVLKPEVYHDLMILAAVLVISLTLILFSVDYVGHRITLFVFLVWSAGGMGILLIKIPVDKVSEGMCFLLYGSMINAEIAFSVISIEVYPTHIRGTANGIIPLLGRAAAIIMQHFVQKGECFYAALAFIGATVLALALVWRLPGLSKKPMHEEVKAAAESALEAERPIEQLAAPAPDGENAANTTLVAPSGEAEAPPGAGATPAATDTPAQANAPVVQTENEGTNSGAAEGGGGGTSTGPLTYSAVMQMRGHRLNRERRHRLIRSEYEIAHRHLRPPVHVRGKPPPWEKLFFGSSSEIPAGVRFVPGEPRRVRTGVARAPSTWTGGSKRRTGQSLTRPGTSLSPLDVNLTAASIRRRLDSLVPAEGERYRTSNRSETFEFRIDIPVDSASTTNQVENAVAKKGSTKASKTQEKKRKSFLKSKEGVVQSKASTSNRNKRCPREESTGSPSHSISAKPHKNEEQG